MYRKILVPLDGSPAAEQVLPHVLQLARTNNAEIVLLRVPLYAYADATAYAKQLALTMEHEQMLVESKKYLNRVRSDLIRLGARVSTVIEDGEPATRIIDYAHKTNVDLIAMFSSARSRWRRLFRSSVTEKVMRGAGKPVLTITPRPGTNP